jgi:Mlc titration factor MtfA (ptsG expression regulator)
MHLIKTSASKAPTANKIILYDSVFFITHNLYEIVIHELSHILYNSLDDNIKDKYLHVAKWEDSNSSGKNSKMIVYRSKFVKEDGKLYPDEDFANNVESYFSKDQKIKKLNPKIFKWIDQFFKNGDR